MSDRLKNIFYFIKDGIALFTADLFLEWGLKDAFVARSALIALMGTFI